MIRNLEIKNFRCFEHIRVEGIQRVNLIGGKNNSGKTALLEALYLNQSSSAESVLALRHIRNESSAFVKAAPEKAWNALFFNQNTDQKAIIVSQAEDDNAPHFIELCAKTTLSDEESRIFNSYYERTGKTLVQVNLFPEDDRRSILELKAKKGNRTNGIIGGALLGADSGGVCILSGFRRQPLLKKVRYLPAFSRPSDAKLAGEFDKADMNDQADQLLQILCFMDDRIEEIKTFNVGEPGLYLRTQAGYLPISLFGEAIRRVTHIVLHILNAEHSVLLIDEIENGIHHENQRQLWKALFHLADAFDIQIFATTHSLEMICAFIDAGGKAGPENAAYIELATEAHTGRIVAINWEPETLKYQIEQKMGVRGE